MLNSDWSEDDDVLQFSYIFYSFYKIMFIYVFMEGGFSVDTHFHKFSHTEGFQFFAISW